METLREGSIGHAKEVVTCIHVLDGVPYAML
jgi:hypothetical protein